MSGINIRRGRGGRVARKQSLPPPKTPESRSQMQTIGDTKRFHFTKDYGAQVAEYVRDHYDKYKSASKRMNFLREMQQVLKIPCSDVQLKNGFILFLSKYDEIRKKLNSSGFGIDPEKDSTLEKGWIKKRCPYFDILDEVMASRPNVTPPAIVTTGTLSEPEVVELETSAESVLDSETGVMDESESTVGGENESTEEVAKSADVKKFVQSAFRGLKRNRDKTNSNSALGTFSEFMNSKLSEASKIEREKLTQQDLQFSSQLQLQKERLEVDRQKITHDISLESKRLDLEAKKLAERDAERKHELKILQLKQDFELQKLKLQLKDANCKE